MIIRPQPLTVAQFAAFGDVIAPNDAKAISINAGTCIRFDELSRTDIDTDGCIALSIFRAQPRQLPLDLEGFERHPLGSQAFLPKGAHPFIIVVTSGEEAPDLEPKSIQAFITAPGQGVNIRRNAWHHPLLALEDTSEFWIVDRSGPGTNLDYRPLTTKITLEQLEQSSN